MIRNADPLERNARKRMEAKISKKLRVKCIHACCHGFRSLVMIVLGMLNFIWVIPPGSLHTAASDSYMISIAHAFYNTSIPGQIFIILVFAAFVFPFGKLLNDLTAISAILRRRAGYRNQHCKNDSGNSAL